MVRLKVIEEVPDFFPTWFQFHYGTIKRLRAQRVERLVAEFQFHYGTIKRLPMPSIPLAKLHFNSTMVRLKVKKILLPTRVCKFQFHYGTIKSLRHSRRSTIPKYFNSTMVRLKDKAPTHKVSRGSYFNSTMVRLKEGGKRRKVFLH